MRAYHSERYEVPLPEGHRFPMRKYRELRRLLLARGVLAPEQLEEAPLATRAELVTVHEPAYLDAVLRGTLSAAEERRIGLPWSETLVLRARASVGGTLAAMRHAAAHGIAGNLAGGTHHAFAGAGAGYCVFNDLAVAARTAIDERLAHRVLVIDLDVHQGDGTAAIFEGDPLVFTFSMHAEKNFPFRKQRSHLDVALPDGTSDAAYLELLSEHLAQALDRARPDLALYQAGVDALAEDTLGRLSLTLEGLRRRDEEVLGTLRRLGVPVVLTMGGGYAEPIERTLEAHLGTYEVAIRAFGA